MNSAIQKIKRNPYVPLVGLFLICLFMRAFVTINFNDDVVFAQIPQDGIIDRLRWNYDNWSTRLVIEFIYYHLYHLPFSSWIWRIVDSLLMVLAAYSMDKIFEEKATYRNMMFICACVLLYPMIQMANAGWVATSANYTWPLAMGIFALTSLKKIVYEEKIYWWQHILYVICLVYAGNAEQVVCLLLGFYTVTGIYLSKKKKIKAVVVIHFIIAVAMFLFKVTGPSNEMVNETIAKTYYPDYYSISAIERITNAFVYSSSHFIRYFNPVFFAILLLISVLIYKKYKMTLYRILSLIPIILCGTLFMRGILGNSMLYGFANFPAGELNINNFNHIAEYIPLAMYLFIVADILILLFLIWENMEKRLLGMVIFCAAFASRMILSFSPSIYSSVTRTFAPMYFCFIALVIYLWMEFDKVQSETTIKKMMYYLVGMLAFLNVISTLIVL